ncbi:hypothetical protein BKP42_60960 [Rhodococcus erythropolis]|nr:hypothetical protein BKP42_60960 [Rhodococcus erythropolis]
MVPSNRSPPASTRSGSRSGRWAFLARGRGRFISTTTDLGSASWCSVGVSGQGSRQPVKSGAVIVRVEEVVVRTVRACGGSIPRRHLWRSDPIWRTVGALPCHYFDIDGNACDSPVAPMGVDADVCSVPPPFGDHKARALAACPGHNRACSGRRDGRAGKAEDNEIHSVQQNRCHVDRGCTWGRDQGEFSRGVNLFVATSAKTLQLRGLGAGATDCQRCSTESLEWSTGYSIAGYPHPWRAGSFNPTHHGGIRCSAYAAIASASHSGRAGSIASTKPRWSGSSTYILPSDRYADAEGVQNWLTAA